MRKIMLVNDDGIQAEGIVRLAKAAVEYGEVWVVAPDGQRSAISHGVNYFSQMDVKEYDFPVEGVHAFSVSGTPADCVRVGLKIMGEKPDVVFSGINRGYNISADIQYSGTVGAAMEASFWGIHAVAFSQDACEMTEVTDHYLSQLMGEYIDLKLPDTQIWNINFPGCPLSECRGVMTGCTLSQDPFYEDDYEVETVADGHRRFKVVPRRNWNATEGTDLYAVTHGYVSVGKLTNIV